MDILEDSLWGKQHLFCFIGCSNDLDPCLNGGTCVDGSCSCQGSFTGIRCEKGNNHNMRIFLIYIIKISICIKLIIVTIDFYQVQNAKTMTAGLTTNMAMEYQNALIWYLIIVKIMATTQQKPAELALKRATVVVSIIYSYFMSGWKPIQLFSISIHYII